METIKLSELKFGDPRIERCVNDLFDMGFDVYLSDTTDKNNVEYITYGKQFGDKNYYAHLTVSSYKWLLDTTTRHKANRETGRGWIWHHQKGNISAEQLVETYNASMNKINIGREKYFELEDDSPFSYIKVER